MILGLDTSSTITGWTCGDGSRAPVCDVWRFEPVSFDDGADYGYLLSQLYEHLGIVFRRFPTIRAVGYEGPILINTWRNPDKGGRPPDSLSKLRLLYPLGPFVEWYCRDIAGVPYHEVGVKEAKKEITGNGNAEKEDIAKIAERCGVILPKVGRTDASDSWAVWKRLLRHYDPRASERWDSAIHSKRSLL